MEQNDELQGCVLQYRPRHPGLQVSHLYIRKSNILKSICGVREFIEKMTFLCILIQRLERSFAR